MAEGYMHWVNPEDMAICVAQQKVDNSGFLTDQVVAEWSTAGVQAKDGTLYATYALITAVVSD